MIGVSLLLLLKWPAIFSLVPFKFFSNNKNIFSYPLDVTNKSKCLEVFNEIQKKFENVEICFFSTGTWNPKKEKDIDVNLNVLGEAVLGEEEAD